MYLGCMTRLVSCLFAAALFGCASAGPNPALPGATGRVTVRSIAPAAGSTIGADSVLVVDVAYSIENFRPGVDYYLAPVFASNEGDGITFSEVDRFSDNFRIPAATGSTTIRYPMAREVRSKQLARPVRVWLFLMERFEAHKTRVIAQTGPFEYAFE